MLLRAFDLMSLLSSPASTTRAVLRQESVRAPLQAAARPAAPGVRAQRTLAGSIGCRGVALHGGMDVSMTLRPAAPDTGIVFRRTDITERANTIEALWCNVVDTRLNTCLGNASGVTAATVEHLMAALAGMGVDNAVVDLDGPEVPIMDGSASPFVFLIECAGLADQDAPAQVIEVLRPVTVTDGNRTASLLPGTDGLEVSVAIDFASEAVRQQSCTVRIEHGTFKGALSRARTFGFLHEVEQLRAAGLAKGGSVDNAVVIAGDKVLNSEGLRFDNEFVRHKILDVVGDLRLAGHGILGRYEGERTGHAMTNRLLHALFAMPNAWRLVPAPVTADEALRASA